MRIGLGLVLIGAVAAGIWTWHAALAHGSVLPAGLLGLAVATGGAAWPAYRLWRIAVGVAPALEWARFRHDGGAVTLCAVPRLGVPALTLHAVPQDLTWVARSLLGLMVDHVRQMHGAWTAGPHSAPLVAADQQRPHRWAWVDNGLGYDVVDDGMDPGAPILLALHIIALAEPMLGTRHGEQLFDRANTLLEPVPATQPTLEVRSLALKGVGDSRVERGQVALGLEALRRAAALSPAWARRFQAHLANAAPNIPADDPRVAFWRTLEIPPGGEENHGTLANNAV